jgi:hypothetical protein
MDADRLREERPMSHDSTETPAQGIFIGWLAIGLLGLMAIFTLVLFVAAASTGFGTA